MNIQVAGLWAVTLLARGCLNIFGALCRVQYTWHVDTLLE